MEEQRRALLLVLVCIGLFSLPASAQPPKIVVHTGHTATVTSVAFSPNGTLIASGSFDGTIKVWDVAMGKEVRTLAENSQWGVRSVTFSPDGSTLASGSSAGVKVWNVAMGEEDRILSKHDGESICVAFSPDGNMLAGCSSDGTIKVWDVATGKEVHTLPGHAHAVFAVAFSRDKSTLASQGFYEVKVWDLATGKESGPIIENSGGYVAAFSADGKTMVSGGADPIRLWDLATGQKIRTFSFSSYELESFRLNRLTPGPFINPVALSFDAKTLASVSANRIKVWDVATGEELRTLTGHNRFPRI